MNIKFFSIQYPGFKIKIDIMSENNQSQPKKRPFVNNNCIWCWACVAIEDRVFYFTEDGLSKARKLDDFKWMSVDDAIAACPVNAINWIDER